MNRHFNQDHGCGQDAAARETSGDPRRLLRGVALILFSAIEASIAMAQLGLRVANPTPNQEITVGVPFTVSGTATGTAGTEPHPIDTVAVQLDSEAPIDANLVSGGRGSPNASLMVAFNATLRVTACGQHKVTVRATDDIGRSAVQTVTITASTGSLGDCATITGSIDTRMGNPNHSNVVELFSGQQIFLYPPIPGGFPVQISATNPGGVSKVQFYDCFDCPTPILLKEVDGVPNTRPTSLTLAYNFSVQNGEQHKLGAAAEGFSNDRSRKGPVLVTAIELPTDVFLADKTAVGSRSYTGVLTGPPGYNGADPDYHYFFIPDAEFAEDADTLGSDSVAQPEVGPTAPGGEIHPEQNGWVVDLNQANQPAPSPYHLTSSDYANWKALADKYGPSGLIPSRLGWTTTNPPSPLTPGVVWAWDPSKDAWSNPLAGGDHIRISGRLRYDHEDRVKPCWDTGSTASAYMTRGKLTQQGPSQGHAEIHPINFIEKITPLDSSARTILWQSACVNDGLFAYSKIVEADLRPMAPQPNGSAIDLQEIIENDFTNWTSIAHHSLRLSSDGRSVRLHVEVRSKPLWGGYGKFRAKYILQWLPAGQAHMVNGCPNCPP